MLSFPGCTTCIVSCKPACDRHRRRQRRPAGAYLFTALVSYFTGVAATSQPPRREPLGGKESLFCRQPLLRRLKNKKQMSGSLFVLDPDADGEGGEAAEEHGQGPKVRRRLPAGAGAQTKRARGGRAGRPVVPCHLRTNEAAGIAAAAYK